jgi:diketogulonate reductase-like aldo/keto reductase
MLLLYNAWCRWRALVLLWRRGVARAIGVSNYNSTHIGEIEEAGLPLPAVNQVLTCSARATARSRSFRSCVRHL